MQRTKHTLALLTAMETDLQSRYRDGDARDDCDLFRLSTCERKNWDFSLPTVTHAYGPFIGKLNETGSIDRFYKAYPALVGVDLKNVLVAGGAVCTAVTDQTRAKDVDFFLYGYHDTDAAVARIRKLFEAIEAGHKRVHRLAWDEQLKKDLLRYQHGDMKRAYKASEYRYDGYRTECKMVRTQSYVSMHLDGVEYQVILRLYQSASQVLHGFDMGPAAIGFDGKHIWVSSLGRLSYEYGINAVDISRRSLSMEYRLKKYFERQFSLVLPWLDMAKVVSTGVSRFGMSERLMLGNMCIEYNRIVGNEIPNARVHCKAAVDYDTAFDIDNEIGVLNANIRALVTNELGKLIVVKPKEWRYDVFSKKNFFGAGFIRMFYYGMDRKLKYDGWNKRNLVYFSPEIRARMFAHFVDVLDGGSGSVADLQYGPFIAEQIDLVFSRVEAASEQGIVFRTVDPGAQFTGSFHPIATTEAAFYGEHFIDPHATAAKWAAEPQ